MITDLTIDPGCKVNCNWSPGNCNILQNNVVISTVILKKRSLTIWTDYLFPDGLMRPKTIQLILCSGAPEHVNSLDHKAKLASPILILLRCGND